MDTKKVQELEEKLAAIQREIEALKAQPVEEEILPGTVVKMWDGGPESQRVGIYGGYAERSFLPHRIDGYCWKYAVPHPNYMMWRKHDGGPQPVGDEVEVYVIFADGDRDISRADNLRWSHDCQGCDIIAFAVLTTPEFT